MLRFRRGLRRTSDGYQPIPHLNTLPEPWPQLRAANKSPPNQGLVPAGRTRARSPTLVYLLDVTQAQPDYPTKAFIPITILV